MKITITRERLEGKGACSSGLELFDDVYPDGVAELEWTRDRVLLGLVLFAPFRRYYGWLVGEGLVPAWSFVRADLRRTDLRGADLRGANLRGADLCRADLCRADLRGANLRGVDLWGADLWGADLCRANLRGANLWGVDLWGADLEGATYNEYTTWPDGFDYKSATQAGV